MDKQPKKKYIILSTLGKGSFGKVKEAIHVASGEKIAIKILEKDKIAQKDDQIRVNREIAINSRVRHNAIAQLYEVIETSKYYFFLLEYGKNGDLASHIEKKGKLSENEAKTYFYQIMLGIQYLESIGCAHRDIKPSNVLLDDDMNAKLIDFGLGNIYSIDDQLQTACGSPCFAAPELVKGKAYTPVQIDVWSAGVSLFLMIFGELPFDAETKTELYRRIVNCEYQFPSYNVSDEILHLIDNILVADPKRRFQVADILSHPWLDQVREPNYDIFSIVLDETAQKMEIQPEVISKMLNGNEHNKYTTMYYLLKKKMKRKDKSQIFLAFDKKTVPQIREKIRSHRKQSVADSNRLNDSNFILRSGQEKKEQSKTFNTYKKTDKSVKIDILKPLNNTVGLPILRKSDSQNGKQTPGFNIRRISMPNKSIVKSISKNVTSPLDTGIQNRSRSVPTRRPEIISPNNSEATKKLRKIIPFQNPYTKNIQSENSTS